jgi:hypothetical protein
MNQVTFDALERFVAKGRRAQNVLDQLAAHGPGLTFGELAIGELFTWPDRLGGAIVKVADDGYEFWIHGKVGGRLGTGTAEDFYRVERWLDAAAEGTLHVRTK